MRVTCRRRSESNIAENKSENKSLPKFDSVDELADYFDTHDMSEHWEYLPEAEFAVNLQKKSCLVSVDSDVMKRLAEVARAQHTSTEVLVNSWLREKTAQIA